MSKRNDEPRTKEAVERVFEESLKSESFEDKNVIEYKGVPKVDYAIQQVWEKINQQLLPGEGCDRTYGGSTLMKEESAASNSFSSADKDVSSPGSTSTFDKMNQKVNQGKNRCASGKIGKEVVKNVARLSRG